jgi:hypothetical protein
MYGYRVYQGGTVRKDRVPLLKDRADPDPNQVVEAIRRHPDMIIQTPGAETLVDPKATSRAA